MVPDSLLVGCRCMLSPLKKGEALYAGKHRGPFGLDILILIVSPSETGRCCPSEAGRLRVGPVRTCSAAVVTQERSKPQQAVAARRDAYPWREEQLG